MENGWRERPLEVSPADLDPRRRGLMPGTKRGPMSRRDVGEHRRRGRRTIPPRHDDRTRLDGLVPPGCGPPFFFRTVPGTLEAPPDRFRGFSVREREEEIAENLSWSGRVARSRVGCGPRRSRAKIRTSPPAVNPFPSIILDDDIRAARDENALVSRRRATFVAVSNRRRCAIRRGTRKRTGGGRKSRRPPADYPRSPRFAGPAAQAVDRVSEDTRGRAGGPSPGARPGRRLGRDDRAGPYSRDSDERP
jgi:hypothetical protein